MIFAVINKKYMSSYSCSLLSLLMTKMWVSSCRVQRNSLPLNVPLQQILLILLNRSMGLRTSLQSSQERRQTLLHKEFAPLQTSSSSSGHTEMFWISKQMLSTKAV